jgi:hypothetical protein
VAHAAILDTVEAKIRNITVHCQPGKKFVRHHLNQYKLGGVVHICSRRYARSINRRITVEAHLGINMKPSKKNR